MADIKKKMEIDLSLKGDQKARQGFSNVEKSISSMTKSVGAAILSTYALKKGFDLTVNAAIAQEQIFRKLKTSIELTGKSWGSSEKELNSLFSRLQQFTEYGDTESADALTTLIQLTGNYRQSVNALPMVLDLASTGLFDMGSSARYIAMALEGNVEMLGRYIPELRASNNEIIKTGTNAQKTAEFMRLFNEKFAGTAQKNLDSTAGQLKQLGNYLVDIGEVIGDTVLPAINGLLGKFTDIFKSDTIRENKQALEEDLSALEHFQDSIQQGLSLSEIENKYGKDRIEYLRAQYGIYKLLPGEFRKAYEMRAKLIELDRQETEQKDRTSLADTVSKMPKATDLAVSSMRNLTREQEKQETLQEKYNRFFTELPVDQQQVIDKQINWNNYLKESNYNVIQITDSIGSLIDTLKTGEFKLSNLLTLTGQIASFIPGGQAIGTGLTIGGTILRAFGAADGANFIANQPTLMMVGEKGREQVNVTPLQPAPINNTNATTLVVNLNGNVYGDVDKLAEEITKRSNLGFNKIQVKA